jgi:hypothetical protein
MALLFANHTITVYATVETPDPTSKIVPVPSEAAGVSLSCQIRPVRNRVVFDSRTGSELINPYEVMLEPEDEASLPYGARVVWEDTEYQFRVTNRPQLRNDTGDFEDLNYAKGEMELLEVTP